MNIIHRYIITALISALVIFLMWYFSDIVIIILISAVISLVGKPLVELLSSLTYKKKGVIPSWGAASITLVAMWAVFILVFVAFAPIVIEKVSALTASKAELTSLLHHTVQQVDTYFKTTLGFNLNLDSNAIVASIEDNVSLTVANSLSWIGSIVGTISTLAVYAFSVSFISFFFLKERALFGNSIVLLFPTRLEDGARRAMSSSTTLLSRYFIGLLIESTIKLVVITTGFYLCGVSFSTSVVAALITAILNVIPYIGPLIGGAIAVVIAVISPEVALTTVAALSCKLAIILTVFQLVDNIIIQPYVYAESVKAHPLEIFIVILMAGSIAGVTGMLLAIPAYTVLRVFSKEFFIRLKVVQKLTEKI